MTGHLLWTGYGPLTRALAGRDGYLRGVGHRYRPRALPWTDLGRLWPPAVCPPILDLAGAIAWYRTRLLGVYDAYAATKALAGRGPWR